MSERERRASGVRKWRAPLSSATVVSRRADFRARRDTSSA